MGNSTGTNRPIEVYFVTNRDKLSGGSPWYGERFHANGSESYRVGSASVSVKGRGENKEYETKSVETFSEKPGPAGDDRGAKLGSARMFSELKQQMREDGRDLVFLIHGYASAFTDALERAAELTEKYRVRGKDGRQRRPLVVAFSWPANGRMAPFVSYISDRQDAAKSGQALARFFFRLCGFFVEEVRAQRIAEKEKGAEAAKEHAPCANRLHLIAHSMGNWALRNGLQAIVEQRGADRLPAIFDNVFLMAADEDEDALQDTLKLALLPRLANGVHIYHSKDDLALVVSDVTKLNPDRLGHNGPLEMDRTDEKVVAIDCRHVDRTSLGHANHQYYRLRKEVIADVCAVLAGLRPEEVPDRTPLVHKRRYLIGKPVSDEQRRASRRRHRD